MFYKIPKGTDLSKTSYRCAKDEGDYTYIEYNEGFVGEEWEQIDEETLIGDLGEDPFDEKVESKEPTQLDRIESTVKVIAENSTSYAEMAAAISEGVNSV